VLEFYNILWGLGTELSYWPAILCSLAGRYDLPIPSRFLAPQDCSKIQALKTFNRFCPLLPTESGERYAQEQREKGKGRLKNFVTA
jgi:hypothetical protein